tara:strand:+ start:2036 stop:2770 length:735 start_codon:yes stop_codon:yes gene_type:complete
MIKKRIILVLTFLDGILFRTKNFKPDYRYTKNFVDLWSADEIILIDLSKKKFEKKFLDTVKFFSKNCFLPISVGGGINTYEKAEYLFRNGADKVIINSSSIKKPELICEINKVYGEQSIIHSIDCKKVLNKYKVFINNSQTNTNLDPINWCKEIINFGVGEILVNNIDNDGGLTGYDIELIKMFEEFKKPILALGGAGSWDHLLKLFNETNASGACTQNIFHFTEKSLISLKSYLKNQNISVRN